jgi:hypothetical protein
MSSQPKNKMRSFPDSIPTVITPLKIKITHKNKKIKLFVARQANVAISSLA